MTETASDDGGTAGSRPIAAIADLAAEIRTAQVMTAEVMWRLGRDHPDFVALAGAVDRLHRVGESLRARSRS